MGGKFLGSGWKFPIEIDSSTGRFKSSSYEEDVQEAIYIILSTSKGERIMREDFGSKLSKYVFETLDKTTIAMMKYDIKEALVNWEPRITDISVEVSRDDKESSKINVDIGYRVRKTNNLFNLVYPFYINEGTKLE